MSRLVHRRLPAVGLLLAASLLLAACGSVRMTTRADSATPPTPPPDTRAQFAPGLPELGRILSFDPAGRIVVIELSPFGAAPGDLAGRALLSRDPASLATSARLVASPRRTGGMLGAYVSSGTPRPGDEVVLAPAP